MIGCVAHAACSILLELDLSVFVGFGSVGSEICDTSVNGRKGRRQGKP